MEWQRQIGLQEEYMCVERVISVLLAESKFNLRPHKALERDGDGMDSEGGGCTTSSLCVLVLREEVLRHTHTIHIPNESTRRKSYTRPQHSLEWYQSVWYKEKQLEL